MIQREALKRKFYIHGNILHTRDFRHDPTFACEYRRLLGELRDELRPVGGDILTIKISQTEFRYELRLPNKDGQYEFPVAV